jgi:hypothetical protein
VPLRIERPPEPLGASGALAPLRPATGRRQRPEAPVPARHRILARRHRGEPARPINVTERQAARRGRRARELCVTRRREAGRCALALAMCWACEAVVRSGGGAPPWIRCAYVSRRDGGIRNVAELSVSPCSWSAGNIPAPDGRGEPVTRGLGVLVPST